VLLISDMWLGDCGKAVKRTAAQADVVVSRIVEPFLQESPMSVMPSGQEGEQMQQPTAL
jgi:hypothetical protein